MLEIPEALAISRQLEKQFKGKRVDNVIVGHSPHKFTWFVDKGVTYHELLVNQTIDQAYPIGGMVEIKAGDARLVFSDGVNLRAYPQGEVLPEKHQLLLSFDDLSHLVASVQMYGGISCFDKNEGYDNPYYLVAKAKPSPHSDTFDTDYFRDLAKPEAVQKLNLKAFLATEQRIPGLGNGVLQDILWTAKLNPRRKVNSLGEEDINRLFNTIKSVLAEMTRLGGRDTEKDLFGNPGGYATVMSSKHAGDYCPACGGMIIKEAYMGGSVYYCDRCQPKET
jgi:formamidopyrimidine-DNA glycosylase